MLFKVIGNNDIVAFTSDPRGSFTGQSYGCIVKKKVILLEELKRDTPDFGGSVCKCLHGVLFGFLMCCQKMI